MAGNAISEDGDTERFESFFMGLVARVGSRKPGDSVSTESVRARRTSFLAKTCRWKSISTNS